MTLGHNLSSSLSSSWDRRGDSEADRARSSRARTSVGEDGDPVLGRESNEGSRRLREDFTITEKAPTERLCFLLVKSTYLLALSLLYKYKNFRKCKPTGE